MCGDYMYRFRTEGGGGLDGWGCICLRVPIDQQTDQNHRQNTPQNTPKQGRKYTI